MLRKYKNIVSICFLMVFLAPYIIRMEHHPEHFHCNAKTEKHIHTHHEECAVCKYEFSVFSTDFTQTALPKHKPVAFYTNHYRSFHHYAPSNYTFLLRAPPVI